MVEGLEVIIVIPILYDKEETGFISNGMARLNDCISCIVTEERNGIYELDFEYPITGANYELIQIGRIVGVTHDDGGDIQPFDIVSYTKPINGIVTFHCTHISYRTSYMTIRNGGSAINSLSDAFNLIKTYARPAYPFTFWTDKTNTGFCACLTTIPYSVRQVLGGIEGSVLDTYGGEYEWNLWTIKLWSSRGQYRDFSIRYGVNMLDYNEDYDSTGCYSSCRPYWTDGTTSVIGDIQNYNAYPPSGRNQCVPLDVSEKFEDVPTKAQVEAMAQSIMNAKNPTLPTKSITVSFVRIQDMGEYSEYENLLKCKLCDSINVIFPDFNSSGTFKIVRTTWNVLTDKYDEMELGSLSVTMSEALGITNDLDRTVTIDYTNLTGKPQINGVTLSGNKSSADLGLQAAISTQQISPSITASTGSVYASAARKYGNVVQLRIQVQNSSATATQQNIFAGTLNTSSILPSMVVTGLGYYGARPVVGQITGAGAIIVRNTNPDSFPALTGTNSLSVSFTYIV